MGFLIHTLNSESGPIVWSFLMIGSLCFIILNSFKCFCFVIVWAWGVIHPKVYTL